MMLSWHADVVSVMHCCSLFMISLDQYFQVYELTELILSVRSQESPGTLLWCLVSQRSFVNWSVVVPAQRVWLSAGENVKW